MTNPSLESSIEESIRYLTSDGAIRDIEANPYWPKWNSPWWHMSVLFEMGMANRIPKTTAEKMLSEVKRTHLPYFFREDAPAGKTADQDAPCPCALGNIYQILSTAGLDVDTVLPWARSWFLKYQMPDGGLSCDEDAYKSLPPASSLVGTIAPLEAILLQTKRPFTAEEENFLDRGADCLIQRKLMLGCQAEFNAEERLDEEDWLKPCFPRFYFYDVLRGLNFVLQWSEKRNQHLPLKAITGALESIGKKFPDGQIAVERHSFEGVGTRVRMTSGEWRRQKDSTFFPLLNQVSAIGQVSPYLTSHWQEAKARIDALILQGLIT